MPYWLIVFLSIARLVLFFVILFSWIGPKFLPHTKKLHGIDKMLYSWIGIGGTIMVTIFVLTIMHMYDLISLFVVLVMIPILIAMFHEWRNGTSLTSIFKVIENKIVANQVRVIESIKVFTYQGLKERFVKKKEFSFYDNRFNISAVLLGITACIVRVIPVLNNAAPHSRSWYYELQEIKNIRLQQYFGELPIPKGMHSLVTMFSSLTQVGPELTLSLLGSLTSFLLTIIIYWLIREITKGKVLIAALFGAGIFALIPTLLLPITLEAETGINTVLLGLCFALPTAFIFVRNLRSVDKAPWFYVTMGIVATALTDLFVLGVVLLPFLIYGLLAIPRKRFAINLIKVVFYLFVVFILALSPYIIYLLIVEGDINSFFEIQLLNTLIFSYFPHLITDIESLSTIYLYITGALFLIFVIIHFVQKKEYFADELVFFTMFATVAFLYSKFNSLDMYYLDLDQVNAFYAILICVLFGLAFYAFYTIIEVSIGIKHRFFAYSQPVLLVVLIASGLFISGGVNVGKTLPQTLPNGFFEAYYRIINERLPYSYATVSPPIDNTLSMNRHYFMNYDFFLNSYGNIDSLYQKYLEIPKELRPDTVNIPPASIFVFVQKPPYESAQQGILFQPGELMESLESWIERFNSLPNREVLVYRETEDAVVYEIINQKDESYIGDILMNIYPKEEGRAAKLFK
ncbi:MAG TPA: hypothetical protein DF712_20635 [Balneola sp.]|nr:hypothetical protein [Bacteroidota bacterium]HCT54859.1 hypothetical protein [Balneola sp.]